MKRTPELMCATPAEPPAQGTELDLATLVANRVLSENGMAGVATSRDRATYRQGFIVFRYDSIDHPDVHFGGGATLVARRSDLLGGMVQCAVDWLAPDSDRDYANIPKAYVRFDAKAAR